MNIEEANPAAAIRLAGDKIGYFHIGESNRGYLGDGVINFDLIFDALIDIGYKRDIVFESFSTSRCGRRPFARLRNLARHMDGQRPACRSCKALHRTQTGRGKTPSRNERTPLNVSVVDQIRSQGRSKLRVSKSERHRCRRKLTAPDPVDQCDRRAAKLLAAAGRMSRADLARKLGLNRSSSGQIVSELTQSGLVREVSDAICEREATLRTAGRPGILLRACPGSGLLRWHRNRCRTYLRRNGSTSPDGRDA